jgi:branched-chain amino acid transport system permease protein
MSTTRVDVRKAWAPALLLVILVLLAALPLRASEYTLITSASFMMYIILAVSWVLFSGPTGYFSLAPAAFFGVGIYAAAVLGMALPLPVVVCVGGLASACLALVVGALTLRLKGVYFAIFTLGLIALIMNFVLWFELQRTGTRGRFVVLVDNTTIYYVMLTILVATLLTGYLIRRSKYGLALQSIGEDEEAAVHVGINVTALKIVTFGISAIFMGAAGAIWATQLTYIDPYIAFDPLNSFLPVLMAIFGGMGQLYGPVLGAAVFAYLREVLIVEFPYYYMLFFGIILLVAVLYLPNGLVGLIQSGIQRWQKRGLGGQHANT